MSDVEVVAHGIQALTVHPTGYGMCVACAIGAHASFARLVIRYRNDGATPSGPGDGMPLLDAPAVAGTTYRGYHHPSYRGFVCTYAAFGLDERGFIHASAAVCGSPPAGS